MSDPQPSSGDLTPAERSAIRSLRSLAKRWPRTLTLASMDGTLVVVRSDDEGFQFGSGSERQENILADDFHGIPNTGGGW